MEEPLAGPQGPSCLCVATLSLAEVTDLARQDVGCHAALWQAEMPLERCAGPNPWNETGTLFRNRAFAGVIKVRILRWRDHPELSEQDLNTASILMREAGGNLTHTHTHTQQEVM